MISHPDLNVLVVSEAGREQGFPWPGFGGDMAHLHVSREASIPDDLTAYHAVVTAAGMVRPGKAERLLQFVHAGGAWLAMSGLQEDPLPDAFGAQPEGVGPRAELRVLLQNADDPLAVRLPDAVYVAGRYHPLQSVAPDAETVLYADWHYGHSPVFITRSHGAGHLACTTLQDFSANMLRQVIHRLLRRWRGSAPSPETRLGVGILGYAPSIGQVHGLAAERTPGLRIAAACDLNAQRLAQAAKDFPGIATYDRSARLAEDPDVDLVIVATAPDTHARLSVEMMDAGKHVLCEKPLALNRRETDAMQETAERRKVHLSCHQNRRFDPDFRAIRDCVAGGRIGELFYLETFVGQYHHPCGYWHSHAPVCGGTAYDWGAHYLDWIVGLMPHSVTSVVGTRHKRVWHDVTNADQERIQIRFADGREAEFLHSDIAAARKPKWYLLGTRGAIVGAWRDVTAVDVDPVHYFEQTDIPATEMMPDITLYHRRDSGDLEQIRPAEPERDPLAFHRNLADHLLWGEPLAAPLADSVKVVALLEAASRSMANGGSVEVLDGR